MAYWKCKNCNTIYELNPLPQTGYCKKCEEHSLLERFDPAKETKKKKYIVYFKLYGVITVEANDIREAKNIVWDTDVRTLFDNIIKDKNNKLVFSHIEEVIDE